MSNEWDKASRSLDVTYGPTRGINDAAPEEWDKASKAIHRQVGGDHYKNLAIQPIDYIMANDMKYCAGNIVKYATRAEAKNGVEDIKKIIHYAELWLEEYR